MAAKLEVRGNPISTENAKVVPVKKGKPRSYKGMEEEVRTILKEELPPKRYQLMTNRLDYYTRMRYLTGIREPDAEPSIIISAENPQFVLSGKGVQGDASPRFVKSVDISTDKTPKINDKNEPNAQRAQTSKSKKDNSSEVLTLPSLSYGLPSTVYSPGSPGTPAYRITPSKNFESSGAYLGFDVPAGPAPSEVTVPDTEQSELGDQEGVPSPPQRARKRYRPAKSYKSSSGDSSRESDIDELQSCLNIQQPKEMVLSEQEAQELRFKHYTQFMHGRSSHVTNPYRKLRKARNDFKYTDTKKYNYRFNTLQSYIDFNKPNQGNPLIIDSSKQSTNQNEVPAEGDNDSGILHVIHEINQPYYFRNNSAKYSYSDIAVHKDLDEYFQVRATPASPRPSRPCTRMSGRMSRSKTARTVRDSVLTEEEWAAGHMTE